ncbi:MAG: Jag N-terminal domain-containing protein [Campylobacterales bacterium]|nr:Jag N-terminal domain-containing protein [Campylobacterales bacterium]
MVRIESKTLDEAYIEASKQLNCSITDLNVEVIQNPSNGIFGLFKKNAIIIVTAKKSINSVENDTVSVKENKVDTSTTITKVKETSPKEKIVHEQQIKKEFALKEKLEDKKSEEKSINTITEEPKKVDVHEEIVKNETIQKEFNNQQDIFDTFYSEKVKVSKNDILAEIKAGIDGMFKYSCFDVNEIKIEYFDENTIYVEIRGNDAALLIGKEGYRYKALSYMLFNWINSKYNLMLRLEIAEFLKNQEEMMSNFLTPFIEKVKKDGRGQTKSLDGVLVHIALTQLRGVFPNKYVSVRTNSDGEKFVIVNDFKSNGR